MFNEIIVPDVRRTTLTKLENYRFYIIAVKASTKEGFGPLGNSRTGRTNQDSTYIFCKFAIFGNQDMKPWPFTKYLSKQKEQIRRQECPLFATFDES